MERLPGRVRDKNGIHTGWRAVSLCVQRICVFCDASLTLCIYWTQTVFARLLHRCRLLVLLCRQRLYFFYKKNCIPTAHTLGIDMESQEQWMWTSDSSTSKNNNSNNTRKKFKNFNLFYILIVYHIFRPGWCWLMHKWCQWNRRKTTAKKVDMKIAFFSTSSWLEKENMKRRSKKTASTECC